MGYVTSPEDEDKLAEFASQLIAAADEIAIRMGLEAPSRLSLIENDMLHLRICCHRGSSAGKWAELWRFYAPQIGLPPGVEPGDRIVDGDGNFWVLLGLDPLSSDYPVRLHDDAGNRMVASLEAAKSFMKAVELKIP